MGMDRGRERDRLLLASAENWRQLGYAEMTLANYLRCVERFLIPSKK